MNLKLFKSLWVTTVLWLIIINQVYPHGDISGKVLDRKTQSPIEGAKVMVTGLSMVTNSDALGNFTFHTDSVIREISISCPFYKEKKIQLLSGQTTLVVYLESTEIILNEVTVESQTINPLSSIVKVDLNARAVNTSQDLMRVVPGLFIAQHAGGGKAEQIFLRGYDVDHGTDIAVSVDGMPVNMVSHAHGQGYADLHFLIPETVQDLDYGKGPYVANQGNLNTAGYIRFNTLDVLDKSRVTIEMGQFNTFRNVNVIDVLGTAKKSLNKSCYLASEFNRTNGPFEKSQDFTRGNLFGKYTAHIGENSFLSLQASYFESKWNASGQIPERAVNAGLISRFGSIDPSEGGRTGRKNVIVNFKTKPSQSTLWQNTLFYANYDFDLFSNFTFFQRDTIHGDQIRQRESRNMVGYTGQFSHDQSFGNLNFRQSYGFNFRFDAIVGSELAYTYQRQLTLSIPVLGNIYETNLGAFADYQWTLGKWKANLGIRYDNLRFEYENSLDSVFMSKAQQKDILSPKLSISYQFNSKIQFYTKAGKGFHSNNTHAVVSQNGKEILPAVYSADLGINSKPISTLWANAALWYMYSEQEFVYVGDEGIIEPIGRTERKGVEFSLRYQPFRWLIADVDATFTAPRLLDANSEESYVPLAPKTTLTAGLAWKFENGINGNIRCRHLGDRPANESNALVAKGYTVFDAGFYYTKPRYEVGLVVQNLFNVQWKEAQFATESRLKSEQQSVNEICFTPGTPLFARMKTSFFF